MTFLELQDAVALKLQDASPEIVASIPDKINESIQEIAEEVELPSLKLLGSVSTVVSQAWVNIKTSITLFSGKLSYVGTSSGSVGIYKWGLEELVSNYPTMTEAGDVEYCTLEGDILWYAKIPTTATALTVVYRAVPATLVNDGNIPTDIPYYLHNGLIVNKTCAKLFDLIEDGLETQKVNTQACIALYDKAVISLRAWASRRRINVGGSFWSA
jgi:hypothetical protein